MTEKKSKAKFIRYPIEKKHEDLKTCFRKKISSESKIESLSLSIWADSRYYLWVDGKYIGTGPSRNWPEFPEKDIYSIRLQDPMHLVQISVLLWHFGTSTSQYIHGADSLAVSGSIRDTQGNLNSFTSDESWLSAEHTGYLSPVPRINVSQSWIEMYDASLFPQDWIKLNFNDENWAHAAEAQAPCSIEGVPYSLESMTKRSIPLLRATARHPQKAVVQKYISCKGMGIRIDYKKAFYPEDTTTEDRLQTGYICCTIESPEDQKLNLALADKLWPEVEEYIYLNGKKATALPGVRELALELKKGINLFLLDVSGARQRFTADLHFKTEKKIEFLKPLSESGAYFIAIGPFESHVIGNIVCADGFELDYQNKDFLQAGKCRTMDELSAFRDLIRPVENVLFDGVKLRSISAEIFLPDSFDTAEGGDFILEASSSIGDHEIIFDMGVEVSGFLKFSIETEGEAEIDFNFAEYLAGKSPEIPDDLDLSMRYKTQGGKTFYRSLNRRGFRYVSLRSRSAFPVRITKLSVEEILYPLDYRGSFKADDENLERIWKMCRRTVELCSEDALIDSPAFEQAFWTGDAYVMSLYHQYLFGEAELIKHSLILAARSMHFSELPDCHLPAGVHLLLTAWAQLWMITAEDYWMFTSDIVFMKEIYPWLLKAAKAFTNHIDERGLLKIDAWNMLDWAGMDTPYRGTIAHLNARLAACFRVVSAVSGVLGYSEEQKKWMDLAGELAQKTDEAFWNEKSSCYIDSIHNNGKNSKVISVQTNLMMMLYGCVPETRKEIIKSFILNPPDDAVTPGSPFLAHFYYDYLFSQGYGERALEGISRQWTPMLEQGTCWETFIGFYKDRLTRSYCHAWSAAPAYLFGAWVLGVRPLVPGFKKILISPVPSGLRKAEGVVPLRAGDAHIKWIVVSDVFKIEIRLPVGTEWVFEPPKAYKNSTEINVSFTSVAETR